jgi:hypothetical protein
VKLPNGEQAIVELTKLRDYCLSREHPRGRHKARVFGAALGLTQDDAEQLRHVLLVAARNNEALLAERDTYGTRYVVDLRMSTRGGEATVRSLWIVQMGLNIPRLTSCYVL